MAIVRHLVELHGGTVKAASEGKDLGATFTITIPIVTELREGALPTSEPKRSAAVRRGRAAHAARRDGTDR